MSEELLENKHNHDEECECGCHEHEHGHHHEHHHDHDEECECGCHEHEHGHHHEHHHDHDEECECGCHEHEHEHHHDHDEECDCGCHEHEHDHHHEHGPHDHHDHGHTYEIEGFKQVETHNHEGAAVCSFEKSTAGAADAVKAAMGERILALRDWLNEKDALIGHLKGFVKECGPVTTFSTVGGDMTVQEHPAAGTDVGFTAISFGVTEEELKDKIVELFADIK